MSSGDVKLEHTTYTVDQVLARLSVLENKLEMEGMYVSSNTTWLAKIVIEQLKREIRRRDDILSRNGFDKVIFE